MIQHNYLSPQNIQQMQQLTTSDEVELYKKSLWFEQIGISRRDWYCCFNLKWTWLTKNFGKLKNEIDFWSVVMLIKNGKPLKRLEVTLSIRVKNSLGQSSTDGDISNTTW